MNRRDDDAFERMRRARVRSFRLTQLAIALLALLMFAIGGYLLTHPHAIGEYIGQVVAGAQAVQR